MRSAVVRSEWGFMRKALRDCTLWELWKGFMGNGMKPFLGWVGL